MPPVIGLTGFAGSGKDLVGSLLRMAGYERIALADAVRAEVAEFLCSAEEAPLALDQDLRKVLNARELTPAMVWSKPTSGLVRRILQQWGTEYRRAEDEDYWVRIADDRLKALGGPAVITDVRFKNECAWIRSRGGVIWRVLRGGPLNKHQSELGVPHLPVDAVIDNCGSLHDLPPRVLAALGR